MTFDVRAAKDNLILLLQGTPGLRAVVDGAPEAMPDTATAWVTVGPLVEDVTPWTAGNVYALRVNLLVTIGFVVAGNEADAEDNVADALGAIALRVLQNRRQAVGGVSPMLGGAVDDLGAPGPAAGPSDYIAIAGSEARVYPLAIPVLQRQVIT